MHPSTLAKRVYFFTLLAFIAFYFYGLGLLPLLGPDEPRYAQVAREMFQRGDLATPTLGGHVWFEKPALLYWMQIAAFKVFGVSESSARLGPAICGLLTVAAVWSVARTIRLTTSPEEWKDYDRWAVLVTASCLGLIVFSRGASFDIVITATTALALSFFLKSELTGDRSELFRLLLGFYSFVGLSLIAKGLVGVVIPFGVIGLYYVLSRRPPRATVWRSLTWGVPVMLVVAGIWYGPVIYQYRWRFINEFFVQHHFARYLSNKYHHPQPFYFYPAMLLMLSLPWTAFLIDAFVQFRQWAAKSSDKTRKFLLFNLSWILFPIIFFSFSASKLPGYILPVLPPAMLLISTSVTRVVAGIGSKWPMKVTGAIAIVMAAGGFAYGWRVAHLSLTCTVLAVTPFLLCGLVAFFWSKAHSIATLSIAGSILVGVIILLSCAAVPVTRRESTRDLLAIADTRGYANTRVLALPGDDRSAEFYASGRVVYGADGEVTPIYDVPHFVMEARQRKEKLLAFVALEDVGLYRDKPGVEIIGDNGKLVLLGLY